MPFTLGETREYLQSRGVRWPEQMLAECYMVMCTKTYWRLGEKYRRVNQYD